MKKQKKPSSDGAENADIPSQQPTSNLTLAPTAEQAKPTGQSTPQTNDPTGSPEGEKPLTIDERIANLENNIERLGKVVMQIVGYIDNTQKSQTSQISQSSQLGPTNPSPAGGANLGQIMPLIQEGIKMLSGPSQPAVDPMIMTIYKGIQDSYMEGFKSYIASINTKNKIADAVLAAIEKNPKFFENASAAEAPA